VARCFSGFRCWVFPLAVGALTLGCSDHKHPEGELMLAFDTDMAVPKDVSGVRLEAQVGNSGELLDFDVGPEKNHLPATFGLRTLDGQAKDVQVTLLAKKDTKTRVVSSATTTIPADRIALLRMPIDWLCTLRVTDEGDGTLANDCADTETCVAGRCQPAAVPEPTLPTYEPGDVFGGGLGDDTSGSCFPTDQAFGAGRGSVVTSDIDPTTCRIKLDNDANTSNFALRVRKGDGLCIEPDLCLITLNKDPVTGWSEVDASGKKATGGGFAALPPAICDELAATSGAILSVYRGIFRPQKVPSTPVCSAWASAGNQRPSSGGEGGAGGEGNASGNVDPETLCPAAGSGKPGADVVDDPGVATYLDVASSLKAQASGLLSQIGRACVDIDGRLGAEDVWTKVGYDPDLPTRESVNLACGAAVQALGGALVSVARVRLGVAPEHCSIDQASELDCEARCSPDASCPDGDRCASADESATCKGACDEGSVCEGSTDALTACNGRCDGVCKGECDGGLCTHIDGAASCDGFCDGACIGQCAGDCTLTAALACGTGSTCRGGCSKPNAAATCNSPLESCAALAPNCGALCGTQAAASATCELGGTFAAKTRLDVQDATLEKTLLNDVLPNLSLLANARDRSNAIAKAEGAVDATGLVAGAKSAGTDTYACARAAGAIALDALSELTTLGEVAGQVLDAATSFVPVEPPLPLPCELALSGDECEQCVANNCCDPLVNCAADASCLGMGGLADPSSGQVPCVIDCVTSKVAPGEAPSDTVKQECAAKCGNKGSLATASVSLLECIDANVDASCGKCYEKAGTSMNGNGGAGGGGSSSEAGQGGGG
jgi:hypothetical protein